MFECAKYAFPIAIIALLLVFAQSSKTDEEFNAIFTQCYADNSIDRAEFEEIMNQYSPEIERETIDQKYKCFLHCLAKEFDILDSDGYVNMESVKTFEQISENVRDAIEECKQVHDGDEDSCEYAFNMMNCLIEKEKQF